MIFIDTQLWIFAQKIPKKEKFRDDNSYNQMVEFHQTSQKFLAQKIQTEEIAMTNHQLGEIFHALAYRGDKLKLEFSKKFCLQLMDSESIHLYLITNEDLKECISLSGESGIHIWDYLCIIPLLREILEIFTCDTHFQNESFQKLGKPITNPLTQWMVL